MGLRRDPGFGEVKECEHYCYRPDNPVHVSVIIKRQSKGDVSGLPITLSQILSCETSVFSLQFFQKPMGAPMAAPPIGDQNVESEPTPRLPPLACADALRESIPQSSTHSLAAPSLVGMSPPSDCEVASGITLDLAPRRGQPLALLQTSPGEFCSKDRALRL
ncbi:hypothetical protein MG293_014975 [Ovis ammon polii]|uniref:Uncharacterized protein n=1 Tax=Ovis ammon polii TaxID=230172 RepID=A0AAD4Y1D0_OVIAM|nr:hypothetical protein MG293_014975 [Ovis ammon polii]